MLTTVDDLKEVLAITGSDQDTYLAKLIARQSSQIEQFCNRVFGRRTVTQTFRFGEIRQTLLLSARPLVSITSVTEDGTVLDTSCYEIQDADAGLLRKLDGNDQPFWWGAGAGWSNAQCWERSCKIVVVYVGGWILPGTNGADLPQDLQDICLDLCARSWHAKGRDPTLRSETVPGMISQTFSAIDSLTTDGGMPLDLAERLAGFVQVATG